MGIAEDLKTLEDLHQKGKLTDQEFSDAKATALQKLGQPAVNPPNKRGVHPITIVARSVLALILISFFYCSRLT